MSYKPAASIKASYFSVAEDSRGPTLCVITGDGNDIDRAFRRFTVSVPGHHAYSFTNAKRAFDDPTKGLYALAGKYFGLSAAAVDAALLACFGSTRPTITLNVYLRFRGIADGTTCVIDPVTVARDFMARNAAPPGGGGGMLLGGGPFGGGGGTPGVAVGQAGGAASAAGGGASAAGSTNGAHATGAAGGAALIGGLMGGGGYSDSRGASAPNEGVITGCETGDGASGGASSADNAIVVISRAAMEAPLGDDTGALVRAALAATALPAAVVHAVLALSDFDGIRVTWTPPVFNFSPGVDRAFVGALREAARSRVPLDVQTTLRGHASRLSKAEEAATATASAVAKLSRSDDGTVVASVLDDFRFDLDSLQAEHEQQRRFFAELAARVARVERGGAAPASTPAPQRAGASPPSRADGSSAGVSTGGSVIPGFQREINRASRRAADAAAELARVRAAGGDVRAATAAFEAAQAEESALRGVGTVTPIGAAHASAVTAASAAPPRGSHAAEPALGELHAQLEMAGAVYGAARDDCSRCGDLMTAREGGNRGPCDVACINAHAALREATDRFNVALARGGHVPGAVAVGSSDEPGLAGADGGAAAATASTSPAAPATPTTVTARHAAPSPAGGASAPLRERTRSLSRAASFGSVTVLAAARAAIVAGKRKARAE